MKFKFLTYFESLAKSTSSFFVPVRNTVTVSDTFLNQKLIVAVIPTHKPKIITYRLIKKLLNWYPSMIVVLVDDSTPESDPSIKIVRRIKELTLTNKKMIYLRTPENKLKAGALNYALDYITVVLSIKPQIVITLDDDIMFERDTVKHMIKGLYSEVDLGAVCTLAKVRNKNLNLLTRLQAMEYHNFNITKISDNGFLKGPLVMPGMLTCFRYAALKESGGFTTGHLIEDYDLTAKLKVKGWKVGISEFAEAYTEVPEDIAGLWKQRVRWTLGGLRVVKDYWKNIAVVFQDLIGHMLFILLFFLVILSFFFACLTCSGNYQLILFLIILAVSNFILANIFSILTFTSYSQKDRKDWVIKLAMFPEFVYGNFLTLILLGAYLFFLYNEVIGKLTKNSKYLRSIYRKGLILFSKAGYSNSWGTKGGLI